MVIFFSGINNFCDDVQFMTKQEVSFYWRACWALLTPLSMIAIFVYSMSSVEPVTYSGKLYPDSANSEAKLRSHILIYIYIFIRIKREKLMI